MPCQAVPGTQKGLETQEELSIVTLNTTVFPAVSRTTHLLDNIKVVDKEFYP